MSELKKKDNAKRQSEYRKRHLKDGTSQRLNVILDLDAKLALERMAKHHHVNNKEMLTRALLDAQTQLIACMNDEQQKWYFDSLPLTHE